MSKYSLSRPLSLKVPPSQMEEQERVLFLLSSLSLSSVRLSLSLCQARSVCRSTEASNVIFLGLQRSIVATQIRTIFHGSHR